MVRDGLQAKDPANMFQKQEFYAVLKLDFPALLIQNDLIQILVWIKAIIYCLLMFTIVKSHYQVMVKTTDHLYHYDTEMHITI